MQWAGFVMARSKKNSAVEWQEVGDAFVESGEFSKAIPAFGRGKAMFFASGDAENAISCGLGISISHIYTGEMKSARDELLAARDSTIALIPDNFELLANVYSLLGTVYNFLGDNAQALAISLEAVAVKKQIPDLEPDELPYNYANIGAIYFARNDFDHAIEYETAARKGYLAIGHTQEYAEIGINLGLALIRKADYQQALTVLLESAELADPKRLEAVQLAAMYIHIGLAQQELRAWAASEAAFRQALAIPDLRSGLSGIAKGNLGLNYLEQGRLPEALTALEAGIAQLRSSKAPDRDDLAKLLLHKGQAQQAAGQLPQAQQTYAEGIRTIQNLPVQANPDTLHVFPRPCNRRTLLRLFTARARAYRLAAQPEKALAVQQQAHLVIDQLRHTFFGEGSRQFLAAYVLPLYEERLDLACTLYAETQDLRYFDIALQTAERNKAVLLQESMQQALARKGGVLPDSLLQAEKSLRLAIDFYEKALYDARNAGDSSRIDLYSTYLIDKQAESDHLESQLQHAYGGFLRLKNQQTVPDAAALQARVREDGTAILEYFVGDSNIYALLVREDQFTLQRLPLPKDLPGAVRQYLNSLADWNFIMEQPGAAWKACAEGGRAFYQALLAPVLGDATPERLLIIPDGLLAYLPFEALLTAESGSPGSYLELPYLLRKCEISYAWSAAMRFGRAAGANGPRAGRSLAFSPAYAQEAIVSEDAVREDAQAALPGAKEEVAAVSANFPGESYVGEAATEAQFKAASGEYSLIHLAMHGILNDTFPSFSFLAFGEGGQEDGRLYAYELEQMSIPADLVVLSACETGTGQLVKGEGVMSLARGFMHAGAGAVMMSLWKLEDRSTADLVKHLYAELGKGGRKSAALRKAKLRYLENADDFTAHPGFWAGLVLIGDSTPLRLDMGLGRGWWIGGGLLLVLLLGLIGWRIRGRKRR